jgi:hypothetical protein
MPSVKPPAFASVERDGNPNACTPTVPDDFVGIRIDAPQEVRYAPGGRDPIDGTFTAIVICGVYCVEAAKVAHHPDPKRAMVVTAIGAATRQAFSSALAPNVSMPPPKDETPPDPKGYEGVAWQGYFNFNLLEYLDLPERPATYTVFVTLDEYRSNVVTVKVSRES